MSWVIVRQDMPENVMSVLPFHKKKKMKKEKKQIARKVCKELEVLLGG